MSAPTRLPMLSRRILPAAAVLLAPMAGRAQDAFPVTAADSAAVAVAAFRTAIVHGQLTAHGDAVPDVLCLARMLPVPSPGTFLDRLGEPDSAVVALLRDRVGNVRPMSACSVEPRR